MLVKAEVLKNFFASADKDDPRALLRKSTPLRCLPDDCHDRSEEKSVFKRAEAFAEFQDSEAPKRKHPKPTKSSGISSIVINPSSFSRTDEGDEDPSGDALVVLLGKASANQKGLEDGVGDHRRGQGWHPDYSPTDLREAARQWWVLSPARAQSVRYLVAVGDHKVRACYKITGGRQVESGRYEFEVEELDRRSGISRRLTKKTNNAVQTRKRGARNPITYISV